jgi:acetyl esterase/lipase
MTMILRVAAALASVVISTTSALAQPKEAFPLWPSEVPGALGKDPVKDIPTLTPFWPDPAKATGAAIVICPGGGYGGLAAHEGSDYALFLNHHGIAGFVLKYRLGSAGYRHPAMLNDVNHAIRTVRANAVQWRLDPKRIGVMGSSAGGHLASTAVTQFDAGKPDAADPIARASSRPDLGILCYPVISMGAVTHQGSRNNLLGKDPSPELVKLLSSELQVTKETPPCFVWHTWEDKGVKIENALSFVAALQASGVRFDFHVYEKGGHGIGLGVRDFTPEKAGLLHPWTSALAGWLKVQGFAK